MIRSAVVTLFILLAKFTGAQTSNAAFFHTGLMPYQLLHIPHYDADKKRRSIVIAIIDDGFNLTHHDLKNYYYQNKKEIRNNHIDDDGNGYTDDYSGWDIADNDNNAMAPENKAEGLFLHGTMIAGIITRTVELAFGKEASAYIKILPIKIIPDNAAVPKYDEGYDALKYALSMNADIICLPWSGGKYDNKYDIYFNEAEKKGVLILAAAGNAYSEPLTPPASHSGVYAITAVDTLLMKLPSSNYEAKVSLSACGENVLAPFAFNDSLYTFCQKTSAAVALATGCAAILKSIHPQQTPDEIMEALMNTASSTDSNNTHYVGKLGAGMPDMTDAIEYIHADSKDKFFNPQRSKGSLVLNKASKLNTWHIKPFGDIKEIRFSIAGDTRKMGGQSLLFRDGNGKIIDNVAVNDFPAEIKITRPEIYVVFKGESPKKTIKLNYYSIATDSTKMYCNGIIQLKDSAGVIEDGSGDQNYSFNNNCKWEITVPEGKNIRIDFESMDTEDEKDNLLIFKGFETLTENMMARLSGNKIPPSLVIDGNRVLIWFTTNETIQRKGWKIRYKAVSDPPGIVPGINEKK